MPLSLEQLIQLYILQKDARSNPGDKQINDLFATEFSKAMAPYDIQATEEVVSPIYKDQPPIPFTLFKPAAANSDTPRPLIIHTHGGPGVYMSPDKLHVEIAYFLSQGYVVACPNYRGSKNYPSSSNPPKKWKDYENMPKQFQFDTGPEDVYTVSTGMMLKPYIDKKRVLLRGGSFGSFINLQLLAQIKTGKFDNIYKGIHVSGGVDFPPALSMPDNVAILMTHSKEDNIAPVADAQLFMENLLLRKLSLGDRAPEIETLLATQGNHHMIMPTLTEKDTDLPAYTELETYLRLTTEFVDATFNGKPFQTRSTYEQLKAISSFSATQDPDTVLRRQIAAYKQAASLSPTTPSSIQAQVQRSDDDQIYGPTKALLRLYLGKEYDPNDLGKNLENFLLNDFRPYEKYPISKIFYTVSGQYLFNDNALLRQMLEMINTEESFLKTHKDYLVLYHAAPEQGLYLYSFINIWLTVLKGESLDQCDQFKTLRMYDYLKEGSFTTVDNFLKRMLVNRHPKMLNYSRSFPEHAVACNPSLVSNSHSTSSSSLYWYYASKTNKPLPLMKIVTEWLEFLGINSKEHIGRYKKLFQQHQMALVLDDQKQAVMQQTFIPMEKARERVYLCQMWGEQFPGNSRELQAPQCIYKLINNPEAFEQALLKNKDDFQNFDNTPNFGDTQNGFKYTGLLQARYLPSNDPNIFRKTYVRSPEHHKKFLADLLLLVREDFAAHLAQGYKVPKALVAGANQYRKSLLSQSSNMPFFKPEQGVSEAFLFKQQVKLSNGLVENPQRNLYGRITKISADRKKSLQQKLRDAEYIPTNELFLFSLCNYLQGYTYYDLLIEAVHNTIMANPKSSQKEQEITKGNLQLVMDTINIMIDKNSMRGKAITPGIYQQLYFLLSDTVSKYAYNPQQHQFTQDSKEKFSELYLFNNSPYALKVA